MKEKIIMSAEIYQTLGFPIPQISAKKNYSHRIEVENKSENDSSVHSYLKQGTRILDLARKKTYQTGTFKSLEVVDILKLSYTQVPIEPYRRSDYFIKTIKRYVKAKLTGINDWETFQKEGLPFLKLILGTYMEKVQITCPEQEAYSLGLCKNVFKSPFAVMFQFDDIPGFKCFGSIGIMNKKKSGYYFYRKARACKSYLINTYDLISYLAFFNSIHLLVSSTESELMNDYLKYYMSVMEKAYSGDDYIYLKQLLIEQEPIPIKALFVEGTLTTKEKVLLFFMNSSLMTIFALIFYDAIQLFHELTYEKSYRKQSKHESAPPYITKKNIPAKVLKAMESSEFNQYFGYIEFDQDMDLEAVKSIEEEFKVINRQFFNGLAFKNTILRFRKLGRQKAGGLYYYLFNTLCVNIHSPGSFIHEYWHMIDDQRNDLSLEPAFNKVVIAYRNAFINNMDHLSPEKREVLRGNTKYNMKYFFRRAEIFAYCGEIYMSRILNVESSLLHSLDTNEEAYPQDKRLDNEIKVYYEQFFEKLKNC